MELEQNDRIINLRDQIQVETEKEKLGELVNELMQTIYELEGKDSRRDR